MYLYDSSNFNPLPPVLSIPSVYKYLVSSSDWLSPDLSTLKFLSRAKELRLWWAVKPQPCSRGSWVYLTLGNTSAPKAPGHTWEESSWCPFGGGQPTTASSPHLWMRLVKRRADLHLLCILYYWGTMGLSQCSAVYCIPQWWYQTTLCAQTFLSIYGLTFSLRWFQQGNQQVIPTWKALSLWDNGCSLLLKAISLEEPRRWS